LSAIGATSFESQCRTYGAEAVLIYFSLQRYRSYGATGRAVAFFVYITFFIGRIANKGKRYIIT